MAKEKQCSHLKQELPGSVEAKRPESPPLLQPIEAKGMLAFDADWRTMNQSECCQLKLAHYGETVCSFFSHTEWGIKSEDIEIVRLIGKGEFGGTYASFIVTFTQSANNLFSLLHLFVSFALSLPLHNCAFPISDVNAGVYKGLQVALKSLSDSSENHSTASRSFLQEAAVMT